MTDTAVVLEEYGSVHVDLEENTVGELQRLAAGRFEVLPTMTHGSYRIQAGSNVGTVTVPGLRLLIKPKVDAANLFHMLASATDLVGMDHALFGYETTRDLAPAFAAFYAHLLERTLSKGIARRYVEREERIVAIRGRIDVPGQQRLAGLPLPIPCRFDDYTADISLNRIVRAAAERLRRLPGIRLPTRQALASLTARLEEASALLPNDVETPTVLTRLDSHYEAVERLARIVLQGSSIIDSTGSASASCFLVDMNRVFERFVETGLRRALRWRLTVHGQEPNHLDVHRIVGIRPDLVFKQAGKTVFVGDAKYKLAAKGLGRDSDYYQLLAYVTALGLRDGVLVYCRADGGPAAREVVVAHAGVRLHTRAISLEGTAAKLDAELDAVGEWIADRCTASAQVIVAPAGTTPFTEAS